MNPTPKKILKSSGDYKKLICFKKAEVVYDLTCYFCSKYMDSRRDRTVDQMIQAARSGKQNIAEGNIDGASAADMELNLLNAAYGSQGELRTDFEDWLRIRGHRQWAKNGEEMKAMWRLGKEHEDSAFFVALAQTRPPETVANMALAMLNQSQYFLFRLMETKQQEAVETPSLGQRIRAERSNNKRSLYREQNERWESFLKQFRGKDSASNASENSDNSGEKTTD